MNLPRPLSNNIVAFTLYAICVLSLVDGTVLTPGFADSIATEYEAEMDFAL